VEHRTFTDDEIASALAMLAANNGNAKKTAAQLGVSRTTLRGWAGRHDNKTGRSKRVEPAAVTTKAEALANRFDAITDKITARVLEGLDHIEVKTASDVRQMLVGGGITTEKASFARGGPTARTESVRIGLIAPDALRSGRLRVIEGRKSEERVAG
jgi:transposase-like protein